LFVLESEWACICVHYHHQKSLLHLYIISVFIIIIIIEGGGGYYLTGIAGISDAVDFVCTTTVESLSCPLRCQYTMS
jgi:hypothetical protein